MSAVRSAGNERPDCVFAVNDVMAVGALARPRIIPVSGEVILRESTRPRRGANR
jgi:DNA-binding LacI/PurR family transcriptional regulator